MVPGVPSVFITAIPEISAPPARAAPGRIRARRWKIVATQPVAASTSLLICGYMTSVLDCSHGLAPVERYHPGATPACLVFRCEDSRPWLVGSFNVQ